MFRGASMRSLRWWWKHGDGCVPERSLRWRCSHSHTVICIHTPTRNHTHTCQRDGGNRRASSHTHTFTRCTKTLTPAMSLAPPTTSVCALTVSPFTHLLFWKCSFVLFFVSVRSSASTPVVKGNSVGFWGGALCVWPLTFVDLHRGDDAVRPSALLHPGRLPGLVRPHHHRHVHQGEGRRAKCKHIQGLKVTVDFLVILIFCFECFQFFRSKSRAAGSDIYSVSHRTQETLQNVVKSGTSVLLHVLQLLPVRFVFQSSRLLIEKIQDSRTLIRHRKFLNLETWKGPIRSDVTD